MDVFFFHFPTFIAYEGQMCRRVCIFGSQSQEFTSLQEVLRCPCFSQEARAVSRGLIALSNPGVRKPTVIWPDTGSSPTTPQTPPGPHYLGNPGGGEHQSRSGTDKEGAEINTSPGAHGSLSDLSACGLGGLTPRRNILDSKKIRSLLYLNTWQTDVKTHQWLIKVYKYINVVYG